MPSTGEHPLKLRFTYGGWENPQTVEWCDGILISRDLFDSSHSSATKVSPSNEDWRQFWRVVDNVKVWEWLPGYDNELVLDGVQWSLKLERHGQKIASNGSNAFPGFAGPEFPDTCDFAKFLDAIQILARRKLE